ncbi:transmembrane protein, putative [Medicago truncatula]|uniref:Transmembrane protein, putative n=1 Tax=Medicago truncatula TaxID=3880 RepID=G7IAY4_MEDTR|nr:transmembrane protein, putative [Medicago truncatula]
MKRKRLFLLFETQIQIRIYAIVVAIVVVVVDRVRLLSSKSNINQQYGVELQRYESSVQISDVTFRRFKFTFAGDIAINMKCTGCSNIILDQINIVSSQGRNPIKALCKKFHRIIYSVIPKVLCI